MATDELVEAERIYLARLLEARLMSLGDEHSNGRGPASRILAEFITVASIFVKLRLPMEHLHRGARYLSLCLEEGGSRET